MSNIDRLLKEVETYYRKEGRSHLPWRKTRDPYKILVSEIMLQQTQVERVLPYYKNFLKEFPTPAALAKAPLSKVLKAWQGLGYNRRAKFLHEAAKVLAKEGYTGQKLPGVGPYTQGAIDAFALNKPSLIIETNIRTVFFYFCFEKPKKKILSGSRAPVHLSLGKYFSSVSDTEVLPLVERALQKSKLEPREFYAALMDYGSYLKRQGVKLNTQSKHYVKQTKFKGSNRELRGAILRELLKKPHTAAGLRKNLHRQSLKTAEEVDVILASLVKEGFAKRKGSSYRLAS